MKLGNRSEGLALVQIMLIFALLAVVAANMQVKQRFEIRRTTSVIQNSQALEFAVAIEEFLKQGLAYDLQETETDTHDEIWYGEQQPIPFGGAVMEPSIQDLDSKFNLNWLSMENGERQRWAKGMERMLSHLGLEPQIARNLLDWFDPDSQAAYVYPQRDPPYLPSNVEMAHISELRLIEGVDDEVYETLRHYVSALPFDSKLNVNTADKAVMMTISDLLQESKIDQIISGRDDGENAYTSVQDMVRANDIKEREQQSINFDTLAVVSNYFELFSVITLDTKVTYLTSVLYRNKENSNIILKLVSRDLASTQQYRFDNLETNQDDPLE